MRWRIIGAVVSDIPAAKAKDHIAGLTVVNDVTARDIQLKGIAGGVVAWTSTAVVRAKEFPTFKPMGPALVTLDEFAEPLDLRITTTVNGAVRQDGRTSQMIFGIPQIIEAVSAAARTRGRRYRPDGTPAGVALATGGYLADGDTIVDITDGARPRGL